MRPDSGVGWPTHRAKVRKASGWRRWARRERRRARAHGVQVVVTRERNGEQLRVEPARP